MEGIHPFTIAWGHKVVERDGFYFAKQMGAIMDAAEPNETKHDGLSININSPGNPITIVRGDNIDLNIHWGDQTCRLQNRRQKRGSDVSEFPQPTDRSGGREP